ncbi:MogA/MoaB family molybdenum cofactor biosynthesis protein [Janibacter limosus]|uniref:MogA/MoaB family molybdenum cofactor biosynthesis protein n=1 Tax=Janibacter limosus TaxID=53458 RepID=UPI0008343AE5|nr:MogA/MoaB family molybdenum cofactor biosynthesis protein [Janibacter limosus]
MSITAVHVITVSDRVSRGVREDRSGQAARELLEAAGHEVTSSVIPDGADEVESVLRASLAAGHRLLVTTGGTGLSPRDRTPEGTARVLDREVPGLAELLRAEGARHTPFAAISRGLVGIVDSGPGGPGTLVVNLPGSTAGVREGLGVLLPLVDHVLDQISGGDH